MYNFDIMNLCTSVCVHCTCYGVEIEDDYLQLSPSVSLSGLHKLRLYWQNLYNKIYFIKNSIWWKPNKMRCRDLFNSLPNRWNRKCIDCILKLLCCRLIVYFLFIYTTVFGYLFFCISYDVNTLLVRPSIDSCGLPSFFLSFFQ